MRPSPQVVGGAVVVGVVFAGGGVSVGTLTVVGGAGADLAFTT